MKEINNNIQESYCSSKVRKLFESKGCTLGEHRDGLITHSLAIEWLRVNFGIWVVINFANKDQWYFDCKKVGLTSGKEYLYKSDYNYSSPQEAIEYGLKYVLEELI